MLHDALYHHDPALSQQAMKVFTSWEHDLPKRGSRSKMAQTAPLRQPIRQTESHGCCYLIQGVACLLNIAAFLGRGIRALNLELFKHILTAPSQNNHPYLRL